MSVDETIRDLTLVLAYLTSWEEHKDSLKRSWKGYDFDVLNRLEAEGMITGSHRAKSLWITPEGEERALQLLSKYGVSI